MPVNPTVNYPGTDSIPEQFRSTMDPSALLTAAGVPMAERGTRLEETPDSTVRMTASIRPGGLS